MFVECLKKIRFNPSLIKMRIIFDYVLLYFLYKNKQNDNAPLHIQYI
jgi:hypothetical protein